VPNQATDGQYGELAGVLAAGATRDISTAYGGGIFALVGSVHPFAVGAFTDPKHDEGKAATGQAMLGGFPTNGVLDVAELTVSVMGARCTDRPIIFKKR
jgi:hypothetical protein